MSYTKPTPSEIISACDSALENANEHGIGAYEIWDAIKGFIPTKDRAKAARALADHLCSGWEDDLVYVTGEKGEES